MMVLAQLYIRCSNSNRERRHHHWLSERRFSLRPVTKTLNDSANQLISLLHRTAISLCQTGRPLFLFLEINKNKPWHVSPRLIRSLKYKQINRATKLTYSIASAMPWKFVECSCILAISVRKQNSDFLFCLKIHAIGCVLSICDGITTGWTNKLGPQTSFNIHYW